MQQIAYRYRIIEKLGQDGIGTYHIAQHHWFCQHLIRQNQAERAGSLTALAQHHPAADANVHQYMEEVMPQLEAALSSEELAQAIERGKTLDLDTVVQDLLDEFAPDDA